MRSRLQAIGVLAALMAVTALAQSSTSITRKNIPGIRNYSRVDATVGCGGATATSAFPALKQEGFTSILNLRLADEPGSDIPAAKKAAAEAGITYLHVPFDAAAPSRDAADRFLELVANPTYQPIYIHCGSANRVGAMWLIKRLVLDGWPTERAVAEAEAIGLRSPALKTFALEYANGGRQP